jgi:hypothetical protein
MASYGALVRKITTAEINRVLREGNYSRWAYFVDAHAGKVGVIYANDTTFAAYAVEDEPDPKLRQFGQEAIKDLVCDPDPQMLILTAGQNQFRAVIFSDPMLVQDDDFLPSLTNDTLLDWQRFIGQHGVSLPPPPTLGKGPKVALALLVALVLFLAISALVFK